MSICKDSIIDMSSSVFVVMPYSSFFWFIRLMSTSDIVGDIAAA